MQPLGSEAVPLSDTYSLITTNKYRDVGDIALKIIYTLTFRTKQNVS